MPLDKVSESHLTAVHSSFCSNADYEEILKARWEAEDREAEAEAMLANGTLFGGNGTVGRTGPAYRPKVRAAQTACAASRLL